MLQPKVKAVFSKKMNPNYMPLLNLRDIGFGFVQYTADGGKPLEYNVTNKPEWDIVKNLINNNARGATWRALYYVAPTAKKQNKKKKGGRGYAKGFTTLSDTEESHNEKPVAADVGSPKKTTQ